MKIFDSSVAPSCKNSFSGCLSRNSFNVIFIYETVIVLLANSLLLFHHQIQKKSFFFDINKTFSKELVMI